MFWLRGLDLNQRPSGYEPDELPGCSTPRQLCSKRLGQPGCFGLPVPLRFTGRLLHPASIMFEALKQPGCLWLPVPLRFTGRLIYPALILNDLPVSRMGTGKLSW